MTLGLSAVGGFSPPTSARLQIVPALGAGPLTVPISDRKRTSSNGDGPTVFQLVQYAADRISDVVDARWAPAPAPRVVGHTLRLVWALSGDGSPTPQTSVTQDGDITVEWLVNGCRLTLLVTAESDINVWAEHADGTMAGDWELPESWGEDDESIRAAREILTFMGDQVLSRRTADITGSAIS